MNKDYKIQGLLPGAQDFSDNFKLHEGHLVQNCNVQRPDGQQEQSATF